MNDSTDALAIQEPRRLAPWTPRFALTVDEAVGLVDMKRAFMKRVMREGEHYGTIPGTPKPTLYKPGAELLLSAMGLHSDSSINTMPPVIDLVGTEHGGEAFVMFQKTCEIYREEIAGERILIARASANCSSWERKYRYRKADRSCPTCGKVGTIIKGKAEYGGGWLCWKNKGGCGAKFADNDKAITSQMAAEIPNPDIADVANTVEKIAAKRALVAATLLATGCSDIFTQDLEDGGSSSDDDRPPPVDPNGEIPTDKATPESVAALKQAQAPAVTAASETAAKPAPASAEVNNDGAPAQGAATAGAPSGPSSKGPRAKRGNVIPAPQGAQSERSAAGVETPPQETNTAIQPPATTSAPPVALVDEEEPDEAGRAAYVEALRQQTREVAAKLQALRVRQHNHNHAAEIALGNMQEQAAVPEVPNPGSDAALAAFINNTYPGRTLADLGEAELDGTEAAPGILRTLDALVERVSKSLPA